MNSISIINAVGEFAEDKDTAAKLRREHLLPALASGKPVEIDFRGVTLTTQSFIHALISETLRVHGETALEKMNFKGCAPAVRDIVETVVQYVLESREQ